jgi:hypothetical protein
MLERQHGFSFLPPSVKRYISITPYLSPSLNSPSKHVTLLGGSWFVLDDVHIPLHFYLIDKRKPIGVIFML